VGANKLPGLKLIELAAQASSTEKPCVSKNRGLWALSFCGSLIRTPAPAVRARARIDFRDHAEASLKPVDWRRGDPYAGPHGKHGYYGKKAFFTMSALSFGPLREIIFLNASTGRVSAKNVSGRR